MGVSGGRAPARADSRGIFSRCGRAERQATGRPRAADVTATVESRLAKGRAKNRSNPLMAALSPANQPAGRDNGRSVAR